MAVITGRKYRAKVLKAQRPKKPKGRPPHPQQAEAKQMLQAGRSINDVADVLGLDRSTVWTWASQLKKAAAVDSGS